MKYTKFISRLLPVFVLFAAILFFVGCLPRPLAIIERPLSSAAFWLNSLGKCQGKEASASAALAVERTQFEALKNENENLRSQLNFFNRQSIIYVTASVIGRSASPVDSIFLIDRGSDDGIKENSAVIVGEGHLVGKVISTSSKTSRVRSILSRSSKVAVSLLNASRTIGLAEGNGGPLLSFEFIPQNEAISINDLVATSGLEENIPPNLVIGLVTNVESSPAAPFQEATIEPLVDFRGFNAVSVIVLPEGL